MSEQAKAVGWTTRLATEADAAALARLHTAVAKDLTARYGRGVWSYGSSERGVISQMRSAKVLLAMAGEHIAGTLQLQTRKPWAIDTAYFTAVPQALYLVSMAVEPSRQRRGVGSLLLDEAIRVAHEWPAYAIRLDAFDAEAGAGGFYLKRGFVEVARVVYKGDPLIYFERML